MSACLAPTLKDTTAKVVANTPLAEGLYLLTLAFESLEVFNTVLGQAGQFVMLSLPQAHAQGFSFRRPFSFHTVDVATLTATLLYKPCGWGTQALTQTQSNETLAVLGALGQPFPTFAHPSQSLLVAGGVGLPPLLRWASHPAHAGATLLYGVRYASHALPLMGDIANVFSPQHTHLMADDGQLPPDVGQMGSVITWLTANKANVLAQPPQQVLVCGPNPMMAAVVHWWQQHAPTVPVYVSLENHMPCGTGACWGCVVAQAPSPTGEALPPLRVCDEGPVINANMLVWHPSGPATDGW
jgi:dihydroorotate dehydrogenase electron transfer subunit